MLGHVRSRIIEHSNDLNDGQRLGAGLTLYTVKNIPVQNSKSGGTQLHPLW